MNKKQAYTHNSANKAIMLMACAVGLFYAPGAYAACTNPAGVAGEVLYNAVVDKPQYCDGTNWREMIETINAPGCSGPSDCTNIGDQCTDTTIFAGCHPVTYTKLFVHPNNQHTGIAWSSESVVTSANDDENGKTNQDWIVANKTIASYPAFKLCDDLNIASALGHTDWYLPSRIEMRYLWAIRDTIGAGPGDAFNADRYWTSTKDGGDNTKAWITYFHSGGSKGSTYTRAKTSTYDVRCMRRE